MVHPSSVIYILLYGASSLILPSSLFYGRWAKGDERLDAKYQVLNAAGSLILLKIYTVILSLYLVPVINTLNH